MVSGHNLELEVNFHNDDVDDPLSDLSYIETRLKKFIRKHKTWKNLHDQEPAEIRFFWAYRARMAEFTKEITFELFPSDERARENYRGGFGRMEIYDFADKLSNLRQDKKLDSILNNIVALLNYINENKLTETLTGKYTSYRRGKKLPKHGDHRTYGNRQGKRAEVWLTDELNAAVADAMDIDGVRNKSDWIRDAIEQKLKTQYRGLELPHPK